MMLLVMDVGNSDISFALFSAKETTPSSYFKARGRFSTIDFRDHDEGAENLTKCLQRHIPKLTSIKNILISCVAPTVLAKLKFFCEKILKCCPQVMGEAKAPFPNQAWVDNPDEVGADLRVSAFAAHAFYGGPLMVVSFGTATTLSKVDERGDFCGTIIAPGIRLMSQALPRAVTHLPEVSFQKPPSVLGLNTQDAMTSGLFWGYVSLVEGLIARLHHEQALMFAQNNLEQMTQVKFMQEKKAPELNRPPLKVIATDGYATLIAPHCDHITIIDSDLTLKGLALIFDTKLKGI